MSTRLRRTRALVRAEDRAARTIISLGGVGVVVAVLGICLYLLVTVLPLFEGGSARPGAAPVAAGGETPVAIVLDDDGRAVTLMAPDGSLRTLMIDDGSEVATARMGAEAPPALLTGPGVDGSLVGVEHDGSFWFGTLGFSSTLLEAGTVARPGVVGATFRAGAAALDREAARGGFVVRTSTGESRLTVPIHARTAPIRLDGAPAHPRLVAASRARSGERFVVLLGDDGRGVLGLSRTVTPMGQPAREQWTSVPLWLGDGGEHEHAESGGDPLRPDWLFITSDGAAILALWRGGLCVRLGVVDGVVVEAERRRLVDQGRTVTSALMLLGGLTLVVGDDAGIAHGYFTARDPRAGTVDALRLVEAHRFRVAEGAVVAMATASRDRLVLAADDRGHATLVHMTSHKRVARLDSRVGAAVSAAVAPRGDAVMLVGAEGRIDHWRITLGHPKASWHALFGRPLYEGQTEGSYVYQSSAGSDQAELKMSLVPLLFGTLKATVFATLFAIPLAVLAAIYTSEFLSPRTRRVIKPVIELMASLPSVVLGFVASMVVAPLLAAWLPGVLACLVAVPVSVLLGAHLWQLVPARVAVRMRGGWQVLLVAACAGLGVAVGLGGASSLESMLFVPSRADTLVRAGSFEQVPEAQWPDWVGMRRAVSPAESRMLRAEGLAFRA
ncbi:MAG: hypothetical protein KF692_11870, partial [Cryobacterium sp.]|nr:hypothetical protein [Cryobacterium sp.]